MNSKNLHPVFNFTGFYILVVFFNFSGRNVVSGANGSKQNSATIPVGIPNSWLHLFQKQRKLRKRLCLTVQRDRYKNFGNIARSVQ